MASDEPSYLNKPIKVENLVCSTEELASALHKKAQNEPNYANFYAQICKRIYHAELSVKVAPALANAELS